MSQFDFQNMPQWDQKEIFHFINISCYATELDVFFIPVSSSNFTPYSSKS